MEEIDKCNLCILIWAVAAVILTVLFCVSNASAYPYVHQGDTINQSETYDFSSIYGWGTYAGQFAHWKYWYDEATDVEPDIIIDVNKLNMYAVYIEPSYMILGNWYRYTGSEVHTNENTFMFRIQPAQSTARKNATVAPTEVATPTVTATPTSTKAPPVTVTIELPPPIPTTVSKFPTVPVGVPEIKLPLSPVIAVIGLVVLICFLRR